MSGAPIVPLPAVPTLPVSEVFTTLQGEGPAAGRPATFIRLGGCNLSCSWCDTPYTWDGSRFDLRKEITRTRVEDILDQVPPRVGLAVVTGGEPLLNQRHGGWEALLAGLFAKQVDVHVETNGTLAPAEVSARLVSQFVVSPKLPHADAGRRTGAEPVDMLSLSSFVPLAWRGRASMKVVVRDLDDCDRAVDLAEQLNWPPRAMWLMPEGTTVDQLQARWRDVAEYAAGAGVNATHRLHVLAWNDERGR